VVECGGLENRCLARDREFESHPLRHLVFLAGSFICLYFAFSATASIPFVSHDSISYFSKFFTTDTSSHISPLYHVSNATGRPLTAILENFFYKQINHLSDLAGLRLITIFVLSLSATILGEIAILLGMEAISAFCISTLIFTLPGAQNLIFVPYLHFALAILLSLVANLLLTKPLKFGLHYFLALIVLETTFWIYQPSTFFFLLPAGFMLISKNNWQAAKKVWIRDISLWLTAAAINYFILRFFFNKLVKSTNHHIAFSLERIKLSIETFLPQAVPQIFNLWNVYYSESLAFTIVAFMSILILIDVFVTKKMGWRRLLLLVSLFFIFNLVWLLFGGYMPRQFIASQGLALMLVFWSALWLIDFFKKARQILFRVWPVLILCAGLIMTKQMVDANVLNNNAELMFIRSQLAKSANSFTRQIHVIRVKDTAKGYNGLPTVYDNINSSTPAYETSDLIRAAIKDFDIPTVNSFVTSSDYGKPYKLTSNSVVINMNDLIDSDWKKYINLHFDRPEKRAAVQPSMIYPNDIDYVNYGVAYAQQGNDAIAMDNYMAAININPNNPQAYYNRARLLYKHNERALALADYEKAIEENPGFVEAYDNRGVVYLNEGKEDLALNDFNKALKLNPDLAEAYINRGIVFGNRGEYDLAMADFDKAIKIDPASQLAYFNKGFYYKKQGFYNEAIINFDKAVKMNSSFHEAYHNRAFCYFYVKDYSNAKKDVKRVIELGFPPDPNLVDALQKQNL
jgi:Tfp pilus assembly protein PilF